MKLRSFAIFCVCIFALAAFAQDQLPVDRTAALKHQPSPAENLMVDYLNRLGVTKFVSSNIPTDQMKGPVPEKLAIRFENDEPIVEFFRANNIPGDLIAQHMHDSSTAMIRPGEWLVLVHLDSKTAKDVFARFAIDGFRADSPAVWLMGGIMVHEIVHEALGGEHELLALEAERKWVSAYKQPADLQTWNISKYLAVLDGQIKAEKSAKPSASL